MWVLGLCQIVQGVWSWDLIWMTQRNLKVAKSVGGEEARDDFNEKGKLMTLAKHQQCYLHKKGSEDIVRYYKFEPEVHHAMDDLPLHN